jgi:lipopolysaccharide export system protein LptA
VELRIKADSFNADDKKGLSVFEGNVNIQKYKDEINASKVIINTDKKHKPTRFEADGNVSFHIQTKEGAIYVGHSQKIIYAPKKKEYYFYNDVYLSQVDKKKVIQGDEVILQIVDGKAYAKGKKSEPVIMIFEIPENEELK